MRSALVIGPSFERRWLAEVAATLLPSGEHPRFPEGADRFPMERFFEELLATAPLRFVLGLRACLWLLVLAPLWLAVRPTTFFGLTAAERIALLDRLRTSDVYVLRELPVLLKMLACLAVCGHPEVQARLGIEPRDAEPPSWARPEER